MTDGKTYTLFDCKHSLADIREFLPDNGASGLELELREGVNVDEEDLKGLLANFPPFQYTLRGRMRYATNKETAEEMKNIVNMIGPSMFNPDERIRMEIVYHDGKEWQQFRE